jgi:glycosyltransferase involved in cell wall biosynthesis
VSLAAPIAPRATRRAMPGTDVLVVSIGATSGWRAAATELSGAFARAGARVQTVITAPGPRVRTFALTDFVQAWAAREAGVRAIRAHDPATIVYCSITAALLWPRPGAVWLDSIAAENRPGRHGIWQRSVERRRLAGAPLLLAMSETSLAPLHGPHADVVVVPVPVEASGAPAGAAPDPGSGAPPPDRDIAVLAYAGDPEKRRLDYVLDAWARARRGDETLVVAGLDRLPSVPGVQMAGRLAPEEYRALLRRARVFVAAPRREDYGIAPLEALADGCMLVSTPAPGPYPALALARELDRRLVDDDLAVALRAALDDPLPGYADRAAELLAPFRREAVDRTIAHSVLPRLMPGWAA